MYQVVAVQELARGKSIPAPVEGWDAITPIAAMPETRAITLDNIFPQPGYLEIRRGHALHENLDPVDDAIESLMPYNALNASNDKLFAAAGTGIFDVTVFVTATNTAVVSGTTNARWQHLNMATTGGQFLWICNGEDKPMTYNGSVWATTSISGITSTDVIQAAIFKERIWMTRKDQLSPAYLPVDAIQGTAAVFDLVGVFNNGGYLQAIGTWTIDGGEGQDDRIAFISSRGEVAVYSGIDPASSTPGIQFDLAGVYQIGAPIGRRCVTKVGGDLAIVCMDGVVPLSKSLITDRAAAITIALTAKIQPVVNQSARLYKDNYGWQLLSYPKGTRAILNVPINEGTEQHQYVMNTITGAWCRFKGENANCWALFKDRLFYGGNNGDVYEADCNGFDEDGVIEFDVETAFNYCDLRGRLKQFLMARALLTTDGQVAPGLAVNVDFSRSAETDAINIEVDPLALWDVATWDSGTWPETSRIVTDWVTVSGEGYCASIRMTGSADSANVDDPTQVLVLQINGWDMLVIDGAFV